MKKYYSFLLH